MTITRTFTVTHICRSFTAPSRQQIAETIHQVLEEELDKSCREGQRILSHDVTQVQDSNQFVLTMFMQKEVIE